jgi:hypothetical protein
MLLDQSNQLYQTKIELEYGQLRPAMDWCHRNCTDKWFVSESTDYVEQFNGNYKFFFESERDYINFLVWKK